MKASDKDIKATLQLIKDQDIKFLGLKFTDTLGTDHNVSIPTTMVDEGFFVEGKMFDGSSIAGWRSIHNSDLSLIPDLSTAVVDPFHAERTLNIRCNVWDPIHLQPYDRDPRSVAARAEAFLESTGIADRCYFGPEPEFFIFDDMRYQISMNKIFVEIDAEEGAWNSSSEYSYGNNGHRPRVKGGYLPSAPIDSSQDLRSEICLILESVGIQVEAHHHEVATANQCEISFRYANLLKAADNTLLLKYVVRNVAHQHGKSATFMPKPMMGDNGSGMHCHQSLAKAGKNLFVGEEYAGLSVMAMHYMGGILKHARALNAFTNSTTNSYKRLVPGFEAPVTLAYSAGNRSAAIRIPYVGNPQARRIETRFPDACANPYLAFSAMMMAGIDGIRNKIDPGKAVDKDLYELSVEEAKNLSTVSSSLSEALEALEQDHGFLLEGGVFTQDMLEAYSEIKRREIQRVNSVPHPAEFEMYYSD